MQCVIVFFSPPVRLHGGLICIVICMARCAPSYTVSNTVRSLEVCVLSATGRAYNTLHQTEWWYSVRDLNRTIQVKHLPHPLYLVSIILNIIPLKHPGIVKENTSTTFDGSLEMIASFRNLLCCSRHGFLMANVIITLYGLRYTKRS